MTTRQSIGPIGPPTERPEPSHCPDCENCWDERDTRLLLNELRWVTDKIGAAVGALDVQLDDLDRTATRPAYNYLAAARERLDHEAGLLAEYIEGQDQGIAGAARQSLREDISECDPYWHVLCKQCHEEREV